MDSREQQLRDLPSVDAVLRILDGAPSGAPRALLVAAVRAAVDERRAAILRGEAPAGSVEDNARRRIEALGRPSLRPVINASGVILHTNLGRAPLSAKAVAAIAAAAAGYSNLEYDLAAGRRGRRDVHAGTLLERLLGAPALVVNNNAAAIFLALNELGAGGETVVSRGELIEIGDGFRIPDIVEKSGTRLREVGTTNRTRIEDYAAAIGSETRALLKVHPSNFRMTGFTAGPTLAELVTLGAKRGVPVVEDLGSGCLTDFSELGIDEPTVGASLAAGVDLVVFSGDKLLGGPQAGILAGKPEIIARVRKNPLFRALRVDKLTYAALAETLRAHLFERWDEIPALCMARADVSELEARAEGLAGNLRPALAITVQTSEARLGGGSTPDHTLASRALVVTPPDGVSAATLERALRVGDPPVVTRIERDRVWLDLRTVAPEQDQTLARAMLDAVELATVRKGQSPEI